MSRVVVVTGASSGVGRACARAFAADGADVGLLARDRESLVATAQEVRQAGQRAHVVAVDVADAEAVEAAAAEIERELGPIDVWVNNAMTSVLAPFQETTPEELARVMAVVFLGSAHGTQAALRRMVPRGRGHVIQVGSALAYRGIPYQTAYCAAKHALNGMYDGIRSELRHDKSPVRITSVHLPAVNTPQFDVVRNKLPRHAQPVPPIYQPEVPARAVVWASHHPRRREVWVGVMTPATIWGGRLAPGLLDWYLGRTGYDSQQTGDPNPPDAPDYLFAPVPGDRGAHGDFEDTARDRSLLLELTMHRGAAASVVAASLAGTAALVARRSRDH